MDGFEFVIRMESLYALEYQEFAHRALRHTSGSGFDQLLTENEVPEVFLRLRDSLSRDSSTLKSWDRAMDDL